MALKLTDPETGNVWKLFGDSQGAYWLDDNSGHLEGPMTAVRAAGYLVRQLGLHRDDCGEVFEWLGL